MDPIGGISYPDEPGASDRLPEGLEHLLVAPVVGPAMRPKLSDGDRVVFDPDQTDPEDGQMVVIRRGAELLPRWARRGPDGRLTFLSGDGCEAIAGGAVGVRLEGVVLMFVPEPGPLPAPWRPAAVGPDGPR